MEYGMLTTTASPRFLAGIALLCLVLTAAPVVQAQPADAWAKCHNDAGPDIAACTEVIAGESDKQKRATALFYRGFAYLTAGGLDKALDDLTACIALGCPLAATALSNRAAIYINQHQYDQALADLDEAIHLDPKSALALSNRGWLLGARRQYDKAIADLDLAIRLAPT